MSFGGPPKPKKPANPGYLAKDTLPPDLTNPFGGAGSLISTSPSGLRRKADVQRTSLIGG